MERLNDRNKSANYHNMFVASPFTTINESTSKQNYIEAYTLLESHNDKNTSIKSKKYSLYAVSKNIDSNTGAIEESIIIY